MRVGVLTGGGDCPGLNAVIRAVVRKGEGIYGHQIVGFRHGWRGVLDGEVVELTLANTRGLIHRGGTILGTSRTNPVKMENGLARVRATLERERIDALDRHRGRGHARRRGGGRGRRSRRRRRSEDHRQRLVRDRRHLRLPDRGADRDRRHRPPAHDRGEPRPGDGGRGDGTPRGMDRDVLGHRRRRRHRPRARAALRHRRGVRAHRAPSLRADRASRSSWSPRARFRRRAPSRASAPTSTSSATCASEGSATSSPTRSGVAPATRRGSRSSVTCCAAARPPRTTACSRPGSASPRSTPPTRATSA